MRKQGFLLVVALFVGVTLLSGWPLAPTPALAQPKPVVLKMQSSYPVAITAYDNFKMFAERVEKMTGGRVKIETLPAGAVVPAFEVLDAVNRGLLDGGHGAPSFWAGKHRAGMLLGGGPAGPFGMDYIDFLGWLYAGGGLDLYQEWYRDVLKMKVVAFPVLPHGPQALGWFKRPIKDWEDFKTLRLRAGGIPAEVFKEAGGSVVVLPGGEILPAGERGVIDAAEWVGGVDDLRFGFHTIWKFHYTPGVHEPSVHGEILFHKDVWDKFPPDIQEIIQGAVADTWIRWWTWFLQQNALAYKELIEKHRVQVLKPPEEIHIAFLKAWDKVMEREAAKDPFYKKVLESQKRWASLMVPYRLSTWLPYNFIGEYYWKGEIYLK